MAEEKLPSPWLVSTDWLSTHLNDPNLVVVDGSFYLPALKRDAEAEFLSSHIPGAVRFDIDAIADHSTSLPHMLPSAADFAAGVGKLGIGDRMTIVVYDGAGLGGSPRATRRAMAASWRVGRITVWPVKKASATTAAISTSASSSSA